jgi:hypothetical protein
MDDKRRDAIAGDFPFISTEVLGAQRADAFERDVGGRICPWI